MRPKRDPLQLCGWFFLPLLHAALVEENECCNTWWIVTPLVKPIRNELQVWNHYHARTRSPEGNFEVRQYRARLIKWMLNDRSGNIWNRRLFLFNLICNPTCFSYSSTKSNIIMKWLNGLSFCSVFFLTILFMTFLTKKFPVLFKTKL